MMSDYLFELLVKNYERFVGKNAMYQASIVYERVFRDFSGCVFSIDDPPNDIIESVLGDVFELVHINKLKRAGNSAMSVTAKCYFIRDGTILSSVVGTNHRFPVSRVEKELFDRYYGSPIKGIHAELSVVSKCITDPVFDVADEVLILVVRNGSGVPARPCKYCMNMIREELVYERGTGVTLVFPITSKVFGVEVIA